MHVTLNGTETRYVLSSEGNNPWLTLIHPLGADLSLWDQLAAHFSEDFQVLRYDLRGHGQTTGAPAASVSQLATDLHDLFDQLGVPRSHVVGLSLGGMVAQELAMSAPDRVNHLVLCDTANVTPEANRPALIERAAQARRDGLAALVEPTLERWLSAGFRQRHPEVVEQISEVLAQTSAEGYAAGCEAVAAFDAGDRLATITAPTLLVAGEDDAMMPLAVIAAMAAAIPGARSTVLPGAHLAPIEHPGEFAKALEDFFATTPANA